MKRGLALQCAKAHAGQTLVIFALGSTLLMAALGLVLDAGYSFAQRREMQNAADTAALAGAQLLAKEPTTTGMLALVRAVAVQNGVPNAADVTCAYTTDTNTNGVASCQANTPPPTNLGTITGVRVSVKEVHETFVMRVVGIKTSGTGAEAGANVQVLSWYTGLAAPFAPCGIETKLDSKHSNDTYSILLVDYVDIVETNNKGEDVVVGTKAVARSDADGFAMIDPDAYSFDWTGNGLPKPGPGVSAPAGKPNFLIHSPRIEKCGLHPSDWKGLNGEDGDLLPEALAHDDPRTSPKQAIWAEPGTKAGPSRQVAGVFGCGPGEADGCIMILPIVDNSGPGGNGDNGYVSVRKLAAFWVTQVGPNEHAGRLIANYPISGDGSAGWSSSYSGPVVIRLSR